MRIDFTGLLCFHYIGVKAMGSQSYATLQLMQVIGDKHVKIIPETLITGCQEGSTNNMLLTSLLTQLTTVDKTKDKVGVKK